MLTKDAMHKAPTRRKGTWKPNAVRQPNASLMNPPRGPPSAEAEPKRMFVIPCHKPRCRSGTRSVIQIEDVVNSPPPPIPATNLATSSASILFATAQRHVPIVKKLSATNSAPFRPMISLNRP